MALYQIDRAGWAVAEWNSALSRFDDTQRRLAVRVAQDNGWFDRAVFALGKQPQEQRLYDLRFRCTTTPPSAASRHAMPSTRPGWLRRSEPKAPSLRVRARLPTPWA